jgi:hypothetical protein
LLQYWFERGNEHPSVKSQTQNKNITNCRTYPSTIEILKQAGKSQFPKEVIYTVYASE